MLNNWVIICLRMKQMSNAVQCYVYILKGISFVIGFFYRVYQKKFTLENTR